MAIYVGGRIRAILGVVGPPRETKETCPNRRSFDPVHDNDRQASRDFLHPPARRAAIACHVQVPSLVLNFSLSIPCCKAVQDAQEALRGAYVAYKRWRLPFGAPNSGHLVFFRMNLWFCEWFCRVTYQRAGQCGSRNSVWRAEDDVEPELGDVPKAGSPGWSVGWSASRTQYCSPKSSNQSWAISSLT